MSEFGIKIKNINAGMLYDVNLGTRDYFTYTDAMFNNSLFSFFLQKNGLNVYKYITYVLEKRPTEEMADSELEKLLPWNDKVFEMCKIER